MFCNGYLLSIMDLMHNLGFSRSFHTIFLMKLHIGYSTLLVFIVLTFTSFHFLLLFSVAILISSLCFSHLWMLALDTRKKLAAFLMPIFSGTLRILSFSSLFSFLYFEGLLGESPDFEGDL